MATTEPAAHDRRDGAAAIASAVELTEAIEATEAVDWAEVPTVETCEAATWTQRLIEARDALDVGAAPLDAVREALTHHKAVVLAVVREQGETGMADLYPAYRQRVGAPRERRTVRKYLAELDDLGLVDARGAKRGRTYAPVREADT